MPAPPLAISNVTAARLVALGQQIRTRRKALGINATVVAEAAGLSRVTLHRIEKGGPAVTMAAYLNVMAALGLDFSLSVPADQVGSAPAASTPAGFPGRLSLESPREALYSPLPRARSSAVEHLTFNEKK